MPKWMVGVLVALMILIAGLQLILRKTEVKTAGPEMSAVPAEQAGVAPPPSQSQVSRPASPAGTQKTCFDGSLEDNLIANGGYSALRSILAPPETDGLFSDAGRYFSCRAVVSNDTAPCDYLPADIPPEMGGSKIPVPTRISCAEEVKAARFIAYMAGKYTDQSACLTQPAFKREKDLAGFCAVAAKGMEGFCGLRPQTSKEQEKRCRMIFPAQKSDCAGDITKKCLARYSTYTAIKAGDAKQCPDLYRGSCAGFAGGPDACAPLAVQAKSSYCSQLVVLKKREDEKLMAEQRYADRLKKIEEDKMAAVLRKEAEKADKEAARQRKENEKLMQENNKNIRKMLGRE